MNQVKVTNKSKIYVGNLPYSATEEQLRDFFEQFGSIKESRLVMDRQTGRPRGIAFITFEAEDGASAALQANGSDFGGRALRVSLAEDNR